MEIRSKHFNQVAILCVAGHFNTEATTYFSQVIDTQIAAGFTNLVIDLKRVDFLTSAGIKALVNAMRQAQQQGGDLRIANAFGRLHTVLHLAGLDQLVNFYPSVVCATASYFTNDNSKHPSAVSSEIEPCC